LHQLQERSVIFENMLQPVISFDRQFFQLINQQWSNSLFDVLMPFIRNQYTWVPLYLFLLVLVLVNFRTRGLWWVLFFLACFALTDLVSAQLFKPFFERLRPCNDAFTAPGVRMLIPCSGSYSFVSSHAANHFGMAMFIFLTMKSFAKPWVWLVFVWAALVSIAQVYVGAHFPLDVACGALLGMVLGRFASYHFTRQFGGLQHLQAAT
jgi:membrane-associated phospholipid phosphatase